MILRDFITRLKTRVLGLVLIFTYGYLEICQNDLLSFGNVFIVQSKYFVVDSFVLVV